MDNVANAKGFMAILQALKELDQALVMITKGTKDGKELQERQREQKLELALASQTSKQLAKDFIQELHIKNKEMKGEINQNLKEQDLYHQINKNIKEIQEKGINPTNQNLLQEQLKEVGKNVNFKETYPLIIKKAEEISKNPQRYSTQSLENERIKMNDLQGRCL